MQHVHETSQDRTSRRRSGWQDAMRIKAASTAPDLSGSTVRDASAIQRAGLAKSRYVLLAAVVMQRRKSPQTPLPSMGMKKRTRNMALRLAPAIALGAVRAKGSQGRRTCSSSAKTSAGAQETT